MNRFDVGEKSGKEGKDMEKLGEQWVEKGPEETGNTCGGGRLAELKFGKSDA